MKVVSAEGVPLGLLGQKAWARDKVRKGAGYENRNRKIEEKESDRWIESLRETQERIPEEVEVITICDRYPLGTYKLTKEKRIEGRSSKR